MNKRQRWGTGDGWFDALETRAFFSFILSSFVAIVFLLFFKTGSHCKALGYPETHSWP